MFQKITNLPKNRTIVITTIFSVFFFTLLIGSLSAMDKETKLMHPMMNPKMYTSNMNCPNCGMMINMWARTRHVFSNSEGNYETCSIRCLADISQKDGEEPKNVKVAVYMDPDTMVSADKAYYVIGSSAKGTMTMKSKIAFETEEKAKTYAELNGGEVSTFMATQKVAAMEAEKTRGKIQNNRMKKGKIVQVTDNDSCSVCGMPPAKYSNNRSQISTKTNQHYHFCSTKCLVNYLEDPKKHVSDAGETKEVYVTVFNEGDSEYAKSLYYVVGSKAMGPMGPEAFPFRKKKQAQGFAEKEGGTVARWEELTPSLVMGRMKELQMGH